MALSARRDRRRSLKPRFAAVALAFPLSLVLFANSTTDEWIVLPTDEELTDAVTPPSILPPVIGIMSQSGTIRIPKPELPPGPRRIGIQAGHWLTAEAPPELRRLTDQTGTTWNGITELSVDLDIADRVATILRKRGFVVDVLPTTIPPGYLADAFVALHADSDGVGSASGYKIAHGSRRGPFEDRLVKDLSEEYGRATGLGVDPNVTRGMTGYYGFTWSRYQHAVAPHTPAAILEMGFLSNDDDRALLMENADEVAAAIANGIARFLAEVPRSEEFANDLVLPAAPFRPLASPSPRG